MSPDRRSVVKRRNANAPFSTLFSPLSFIRQLLSISTMTETTTTSLLLRQLEELHLVSCSLLPGESLSFSPTADDEQIWTTLLESYPEVDVTRTPTTSARFEIKAAGSRVWFEVNIPPDYWIIGDSRPVISVRGEGIVRSEQAHWENILAERMHELNGCEYVQLLLIRSPPAYAVHAAISSMS